MMIPKIFHRVWLGGKPMPDHFILWGEGWRKAHPGWTMRLWTEREIRTFENLDLLSKCSSLAQRADIVRYEALFREGGVYLDTDMECVRNIEPLIQDVNLFACWQRSGILSNAIFGASPGHPAMGELVKRSRSDFRTDPWNAMGPPLFTKVVTAQDGALIVPRKTFIPYTRAEYEAFPKHPMEGLVPPPESYSINHRSSVWHGDSSRRLDGAAMFTQSEAIAILGDVKYWHYRFKFPWGETTPGKPGWGERVEKRREHFFGPLLDLYGGLLKGKHVLDLGCCQGYWSFLARRSGAESTLGIDGSEAFIREADAVQSILGPGGCFFMQANLEDDLWWKSVVGTREITLLLGTLFHLTDPVHVLRRAMSLTSETIVIDGEVLLEEAPRIELRDRTPGEPTTSGSGMTSDLRAVCSPATIEKVLRDGGFKTIRRLEPSPEMPQDYLDGRTASFLATRS
jgi:2-polyprenyl-3-methyl-5-hydroxy-6-metoxy-1,4-benzoquinol methylase